MLLFFLSLTIVANGQLVDSGLDAVNSDAVTNQIKPNSCKGNKSTGSWWACGYMELENGTAKYTTDKGPQLRQKIALTANTTYTLSFDAWKVEDSELVTKHLFVTFQEDPGDANLNTVPFEPGLTKVDVGSVSDLHKWTYKVENTISQTFTIEFTPEDTKEYILSIGRGNNADLTYVDNVLLNSATAAVSNQSNSSVEVYPNPSNSIVGIQSSALIQNIVLLNAIGSTVKSQSLNSNSGYIDVSNYSQEFMC